LNGEGKSANAFPSPEAHLDLGWFRYAETFDVIADNTYNT